MQTYTADMTMLMRIKTKAYTYQNRPQYKIAAGCSNEDGKIRSAWIVRNVIRLDTQAMTVTLCRNRI